MDDRTEEVLQPEELLRVMDAAAVVRARQEAMDEHGAFDREATVREIQVMYEELGELVDRDVIEAALDEYLSRRRTFRPAPRTFATLLAWMYVRRGMLTRRVLAPVAVAAGLVWGGLALRGQLAQRALEEDARVLRSRVETLWSGHRQHLGEIRALRSSEILARLPDREADAVGDHLAAAEADLTSFTGSMGSLPAAEVIPDDAGRPYVDEGLARLPPAEAALDGAGRNLDDARAILRAQEQLESLSSEAERLSAAIEQAALEDGVAQRGGELLAVARRQAGSRDGDALGGTIDQMDRILTVLDQEYGVVVTGGVWRVPDEDPDTRNHYLLVRAVDARGDPVRVRIENEEDGRIEMVSEWGERVPVEVYERVGADKEDDGIIQDDHFGTKRRGYLTMDRVQPDLGQITEW